MHKMLTRLRCFFVPDFRDRLSALAELRCLVCAVFMASLITLQFR